MGSLDDVVFNQTGAGLKAKLNIGIVYPWPVLKRIREVVVANLVAVSPIYFYVIAVRIIRLNALDPTICAG